MGHHQLRDLGEDVVDTSAASPVSRIAYEDEAGLVVSARRRLPGLPSPVAVDVAGARDVVIDPPPQATPAAVVAARSVTGDFRRHFVAVCATCDAERPPVSAS